MDNVLTAGVQKSYLRGSSVVSCHYEEVFSEILLPGSGEKPGNCAGWFPTKFCPECGLPHLSKGNCKRIICPDCSTEWRYNRVKNILKRIISYKWEKGKRVRHFVISPEPEKVEKIEKGEDVLDLFKWAYKIAKNKGADGGMVIFHPYRLKTDRKSELRAIAKKKDGWSPGDFHLWKTLVKLDNWENYVYFYPHFHVLATTDKGKDFEPGNLGSCVWKGVSEVSSPIGVLKCSMYLLSHTGSFEGLEKQVQAIRWFGNLAPCKWSLKKASDSVKAKTKLKVDKLIGSFKDEEGVGFSECSECGAELVSMEKADEFLECNKFSKERKILLRNAWRWRQGMVPPPPGSRNLSEKEVLEYLKTVHKSSGHFAGRLENVKPGYPEGKPTVKVPDYVKAVQKEKLKKRKPFSS